MRIIGGKHRGARIGRPPSMITRPTMDRVRESIYNMLKHAEVDGRTGFVEDAVVLDAFAGSGSLGLEALSRGSRFVYFFDKNTRALSTVRENVWTLKESEHTKVLKADATQPPKAPEPMDLVLLDPPFGKDLVSQCLKPLTKAGWITQETLIVCEIASTEDLNLPEGFKIVKEKVYGTSQMFFLKMDA